MFPLIVPLAGDGLVSGREDLLVVFVAGVWLLLSLLFLYVGLRAIANGFGQYRLGARIRNTPTGRADSLSLGRSELHGEVLPADETLAQPFADGDCVYVEWEIEEYQRSDDRSSWGLVDRDVDGVPFVLEDDTGQVRVTDPSRGFDGEFESRLPFLLSEDRKTGRVVEAGDEVPDQVRQFCEERDIDVRGDDKRRYVQQAIEVGTDVYVYGEATRRDDPAPGDPEIEILPEETTGELVVSDRAPSDLPNSFRKRALISVVVGILTAALFGLIPLYLFVRDWVPALAGTLL